MLGPGTQDLESHQIQHLSASSLPSFSYFYPIPPRFYLFHVCDYLTMSSTYKITANDVNAHISERFAPSFAANHSPSRSDFTPLPSVDRPILEIRDYFKVAQKPTVSSSWLEKPEIPSPTEILSDPNDQSSEKIIDVIEELRPNKIEGAYDSNEEYLETQYRLLREDSIRPLREAIDQVRASPYLDEAEYAGGSIGLYEPVSHPAESVLKTFIDLHRYTLHLLSSHLEAWLRESPFLLVV